MEKFERKEKLASAKLNRLVDELNANTENIENLNKTLYDEEVGDIPVLEKDVEKVKEVVEEIRLFKYPNATIIGNPSISHGSVSGFTKTDYLHLTKAFNFNNDTFAVELDFTTGSDVTTHQVLIGSNGSIELFINSGQIGIKISTNGTTWEEARWSDARLNPNTHYQVRVFWNKLQYTVGYKTYGSGEYINTITFTLAQQPFVQTWNIGISNVNTQTGNPFRGTVNLNNWYVSSRGEIIWQGMDDAGLATRLATDLSNIDKEGVGRIEEISDAKSPFSVVDGKLCVTFKQ